MSSLICYIQRSGAGAAISGLILADRRQLRQWTPGTTSSDPQAQRHAVDAAARWLVEQLATSTGGRRKKLTLCLDLDGSRCAWLSAPSAEHDVVKAAARAASVGAADEAGAGPGMGSVWASEHGDPGVDLSVQGLGETLNGSEGGVALAKSRPAVAQGQRQRLAVLAVPDASVRVLIDELDQHGVEVANVITLWHALAGVWDPARAEAVAGGTLRASARAGEVASSEPVTAILALDPQGRLAWVWSRDGTLLAAGSQRLRTLEVARGADAPEAAEPPAGTRFRAAPSILEISSADSGRVVSEWLAWSAQLGVAPSRVVCVGPADIVATGLASGSGLAALGQALAAGWPGAHAAGVEEDDPISATLQRLAGVDGDSDDGEAAIGGRTQLVDLASRPGRLSRAMHWWLAVAALAGAGVLGSLAWKLDASAKEIASAAEAEAGERAKILKQVEASFPTIQKDPDPGRVLAAGLNQLRKTREDKLPERPIAAALARIVNVASTIEHLKLKKLTMASITGLTIDFVVPDSLPGGQLLEALRAGGPVTETVGIKWDGTTTAQTSPVPGQTEPQRIYKLRGIWQDVKPVAAPRPAGAAPDKDKPASDKPAEPSPEATPAEKPTPLTPMDKRKEGE